MKKAFIDQLLLGFLILTSIAVFVATVNDERQVRNKYYDLDDLASESNKSMALTYNRFINSGLVASENDAMCLAQTMATNMVSASSLGSELISNNAISFVWRDSDGDTRPDSVTTNIAPYNQSTFWYRLLGKDDFTIPGLSKAVSLLQTNYDVTIFFRDVINAGFFNMVGTYELDENGCASDPQIILDNKNDFSKGDTLAEIRWPKRKVFFISDGYRRFGDYSSGNNNTISLDTQIEFEHDCVNNPNSTPVVKITTDDGKVQRSTDSENPQYSYLSQRAHTFFEDSNFNHDNGYDHMNEIAESKYAQFIAYIEDTGHHTSEATAYYNSLSTAQKSEVGPAHTYEEWLDYARDNNIDFSTDPNDNFVFVSEDLSTINGDEPWNSDKDFTDMSINMKKIFIPDEIDPSNISSDAVITLICN